MQMSFDNVQSLTLHLGMMCKLEGWYCVVGDRGLMRIGQWIGKLKQVYLIMYTLNFKDWYVHSITSVFQCLQKHFSYEVSKEKEQPNRCSGISLQPSFHSPFPLRLFYIIPQKLPHSCLRGESVIGAIAITTSVSFLNIGQWIARMLWCTERKQD